MASLFSRRTAVQLYRGEKIFKYSLSTTPVAKPAPNPDNEVKWTSAKPFDEIPGPKRIPILGTTWVNLPFRGSFNNHRILEIS